ncbi:MFS transporter [Nocardioides sp. B-3]|nr:MFS transporter [Nocardioides sp. B-3]
MTALLCRPYVGRLSDSRGRIPLMIFGAVLAGVGMLLIPFVSSLEALVAIRLLQGVAEAAFFVASFALLADIAPPERMGEAISYNSLGFYLGLALGPPLGEALLSHWSYGAAWTGAAMLCAVTVGLTLLIVEPPRDRSIVGHGKLIHRPGIPASLGFFSSLVAVGGFLAFASLHSAEVGMSNTSLALLVYGLVVVVCRILFARVPDRVPSLPLGAAALVAMALGLTVMALWLTPAGLMVGVVVTAVGVTFSAPAFFSAIFATATPSERGAAAGTASAFIDSGPGVRADLPGSRGSVERDPGRVPCRCWLRRTRCCVGGLAQHPACGRGGVITGPRRATVRRGRPRHRSRPCGSRRSRR